MCVVVGLRPYWRESGSKQDIHSGSVVPSQRLQSASIAMRLPSFSCFSTVSGRLALSSDVLLELTFAHLIWVLYKVKICIMSVNVCICVCVCTCVHACVQSSE